MRIPKELLANVRHIAKLAGVTPTQVFNVILAARVASVPQASDARSLTPETAVSK